MAIRKRAFTNQDIERFEHTASYNPVLTTATTGCCPTYQVFCPSHFICGG